MAKMSAELAKYGIAAALGGLIGFGLHPPTEAAPGPMTLQPILGKTEAGSTTELRIHVVGSVKSPGMYTLAPGSRIADAIEKAGGNTKDADMDQLNLAMRLEDGVQVVVPKKGTLLADGPGVTGDLPVNPFSHQVAPTGIGSVMRTSSGRAPRIPSNHSTASTKPSPGSISLNSAGPAELDRLPGVGPSTAAKIIEYRREHGGFASIDELLAVSGIGEKKLANMRPYLRL